MTPDPMTDLFLMRHGQSLWNETGRIQGHKDDEPNPLTDQGVAQIRSNVPVLRSLGIDVIYSSDLQRSKQGATLIAEELGVPLFLDPRLREISFGPAIEGIPVAEFKSRYPNYADCFKNWDLPMGQGETINQVISRMDEGMRSFARNHSPNTRILIASHGAAIGNLLQSLTGGEYVALKNAEIVHIQYSHASDRLVYGLSRGSPYARDAW